jgi:uncharacterized membrane-anchored protein YhcB (DUF1043 family)
MRVTTALVVGVAVGTVLAHLGYTAYERSYDHRGTVYQAWARRTALPTTTNPYTKTNRR